MVPLVGGLLLAILVAFGAVQAVTGDDGESELDAGAPSDRPTTPLDCPVLDTSMDGVTMVAFFGEVRAYLERERPKSLATTGVLRGSARPDNGPSHDRGRAPKDLPSSPCRTGAVRVRPHRLRHTFGTDLAVAGIDLLVLGQLMGHAHVETTAAYVHLGPETIAAEWA